MKSINSEKSLSAIVEESKNDYDSKVYPSESGKKQLLQYSTYSIDKYCTEK